MSVIIFDLDKRIRHFKEGQFTGILSIDAGSEETWHLYFLAGQIVWANTQNHAKRRWHRQILKHCPELIQQKHSAYQSLNYSALAKLVVRKKFSRERFSAIVAGCISEILFDILQGGTLNFQVSRKLLIYQARPQNAAEFPCIGLQCKDSQIWGQVKQDWQSWEQSNLTNILPNQAPVVEQPSSLREQTSQATFQALISLVDGQQTLRDLAVRVKQPLVPLTLSILPHIQKEIIRTVDVSDLILDECAVNSSPLTLQTSPDSGIPPQGAVTQNNLPRKTRPRNAMSYGDTVIYIDDSPTDSQAMAQIIEAAGYRYVNIADPLQALPQLLELQPKLIFLDLVMPIANGYELCAQIRRISAFQETPIVIVTNNDGIADRVRAKVVGASSFLGKPINQQRVLKVLKKYLQDHENTSDSAHRHPQLLPSI